MKKIALFSLMCLGAVSCFADDDGCIALGRKVPYDEILLDKMNFEDCAKMGSTKHIKANLKQYVTKWRLMCFEQDKGPGLIACVPDECKNDSFSWKTYGCECTEEEEIATTNILAVVGCTGQSCIPIKKGHCVNKKYFACMTAIDSKTETKITWNSQECVCTDDDKTFDYGAKKCVKKSGGGNKTSKSTPTSTKPKTGACDKYKNNKAALDCCTAGQNWNEKTKSCDCKEENETWDAEKRQCIAKEMPVVEKECTYKFEGSIKCNGKNFTLSEPKEVKVKCPKDVDNSSIINDIKKLFDEDVEKLKKAEEELCKKFVTIPAGPSEGEIESAKSTLAAFTGRAEKEASVWKDAEGNFNKARLASDLTAGVVLGTVGGVVSGVVIKKKQVEKGFEALHCTVGGQKIAGWGDEFSVGLNK